MSRSLRSSFVSSALPFALLALAPAFAAGCSFDSSGVGRPSGDSPEGDPAGEGSGGGGDGENPNEAPGVHTDSLGCPGRVILINACNYVTTAEKNVAAGFTPIQPGEDFATSGRTIFDLYQPTQECKDALAEWMNFDASWNKNDPKVKKAKDVALTSLHTLFFHPLMVPEDGSFIWKASPIKMETAFWKGMGAMPIPATNDYVLQRSYANEPLMNSFRTNVTKIAHLDDIIDGSTQIHMQTYGGLVEVNGFWLTHPENADKDDPTALARWKYTVAGTFFHEMQHADGYTQHDGCGADNWGFESSCDSTLDHSSYGRQVQLGQAFFYGLAYSRAANDYAMLESTSILRQNYAANCEKGTERVNDVASWVRDNDVARTMCSPSAPVDAVLAKRKPVPAAGTRPPQTPKEDAGQDYFCL